MDFIGGLCYKLWRILIEFWILKSKKLNNSLVIFFQLILIIIFIIFLFFAKMDKKLICPEYYDIEYILNE